MPRRLPLVLHLHTLPQVAGSGINTFLTMRGLAGEFEPAMGCRPGGRLEEKVRAAGYGFHPIPSLVQPVSPAADLAALREIRRLLLDLAPDVLHTHNSKAGFLGRLAARTIPAARRPRVVHTVHGFAFHDAESALRRFLFRTLERMAFGWADATIAISPTLAEWGAREGIGHREAYRVIPSGIDLADFHPRSVEETERIRREVFGLAPGVHPIGLVAKLWSGKGHEVLLAAAARLAEERNDFALVFLGEGPLEERLRARARELGIAERVRFLGFREDVAACTAALVVATLPSFFEGMGRVVLEALASGVPVVASRVGGIPDIAGAGAVLVPPGDAAALAGAIAGLLDDSARRAKLGAAGIRAVDERFSTRAMAREIGKVYRGVLRRG